MYNKIILFIGNNGYCYTSAASLALKTFLPCINLNVSNVSRSGYIDLTVINGQKKLVIKT